MHDSSCGEERLGDPLQAVGAAPHDDHLEAALVVEVHVHRRAHLVAELVLHLGEPFGQLAHVMPVDD
ncbi:MAG TPA: hypothetical protein VE987_16780, partial [Polyangiaceae bacterium]|nr:hypothetical protein [Polyangiaceae bacterium]